MPVCISSARSRFPSRYFFFHALHIFCRFSPEIYHFVVHFASNLKFGHMFSIFKFKKKVNGSEAHGMHRGFVEQRKIRVHHEGTYLLFNASNIFAKIQIFLQEIIKMLQISTYIIRLVRKCLKYLEIFRLHFFSSHDIKSNISFLFTEI